MTVNDVDVVDVTELTNTLNVAELDHNSTKLEMSDALKNAFDDENFEFKVRQTPLPAPKEILEKGSFLSSKDLSLTRIFISMSDVVGFWGKSAAEVGGFLCFSWAIINSVVLLNAMRDRTSGMKHYLECHG